MTTEQIKFAAIQHAKEVLGEEQFDTNKDAAVSIADDFKAGVKWAVLQPQPKIELLPTICVDTALGVLTVSHEAIDQAGGFMPWLRSSGYIDEDETEDDITYWQGPLLTREAYNALPELT